MSSRKRRGRWGGGGGGGGGTGGHDHDVGSVWQEEEREGGHWGT